MLKLANDIKERMPSGWKAQCNIVILFLFHFRPGRPLPPPLSAAVSVSWLQSATAALLLAAATWALSVPAHDYCL